MNNESNNPIHGMKIVSHQYQWMNPNNKQNPHDYSLEWKTVVTTHGQTIQNRIDEILAYRFEGKQIYRVRSLYALCDEVTKYMIKNKIAEADYPSLLDKTGNILDLNTCLVPISTMRRLLKIEEQMEKVFPAFVAGISAIYVLGSHGETEGHESPLLEKWAEWSGTHDYTFPEDGDPEKVVDSGVDAMESFLKDKRDAYREKDYD